jgi:eukaryotic-like serine/threonine-protein kinase
MDKREARAADSGAGQETRIIHIAPSPAQEARGMTPIAEMTLEQLQHNFASVIRAGAIYYPTAYSFVRELGRGRQGVVFLANRQGARGCITEHAIKVLDPTLYRTPQEYWTDMGRIASQISRLQRLQSPNLLSRYTYEETFGIGYIQMEAIDGIDLERLLRKDHLDAVRASCSAREWSKITRPVFRIESDRVRLQPGVVVYILRSMLRGLEVLHAAGFLHSDIKPANIMIDRLGNVKIVDFGRAVTVGERVTFLLGSPLYMAPEVHRRETGSTHSDSYSVGLVALEMLSGQKLVEDDRVSEDELLKIKTGLLQKLPSILPAHVLANKDLAAILRKFIEPDPAKRYASAKDAEVGDEGLRIIDKQLVRAGLDSEYSRDLADYLSKLIDIRTQRIEAPAPKPAR